MRSTVRVPPHRRRPTDRFAELRPRPPDVLGVCDTLTEARHATTMLAARGITTARISVIMPPRARGSRVTSADGEIMVLLHGRRGDTERAHEILADAAARADDPLVPVD